MKRFFAVLTTAAMIAAPSLSFATEDTTETSSAASTAKPCDALLGLRKAQCLAKIRLERKKKKDRVQRRNDAKVLDRISTCREKTGSEKIACMKRFRNTLKSGRKPVQRIIQRTVRGKVVESSEE